MAKKNKWKNWYILFLGLIVLLALILHQFFNFPIKMDPLTYFFISILVVILFFPLIKEIEILNFIKIKKELDDFREKVSDKLNLIQNIVLTSVTNTNTQTQIQKNYFEISPSKEALALSVSAIKRDIEKIPKLEQEKIYSRVNKVLSGVNKETQYLFNVRFLIERKINELLEFMNFKKDKRRTLGQSLSLLESSQFYNKNITNLIRKILSICNNAVHGGNVSKDEYAYVADISNKILFMLEETLTEAKKEDKRFKGIIP